MSSKEFNTSYKTGNEGGFGNNSTSTIFANPIRMGFEKKELHRVLDRSRNITTEKFENLPRVDEITEITEAAIRSHFGKVTVDGRENSLLGGQKGISKTLEEFGQNLSTNPKLVNKEGGKNIVNQVTLTDKCKDFSDELQRCLRLEGLNSVIVEGLWFTHFSLRTVGDEGEVIIEPTLGQYLTGFNNVFVGKPYELKSTVIEYANQEKLSYIDSSREYKKRIVIKSDPEVFFNNQWPPLPNLDKAKIISPLKFFRQSKRAFV